MSNSLPSDSLSIPLPEGPGLALPRPLKEVREHRSFASFRAIGALLLREMQTSNNRMAGGYLWSIAEPVGGIVILTLIFSVGFRQPPVGTSFAMFYATGIVPFMAYIDISNKVAGSVRQSATLLNYPAVTFVDALLARIIFTTITQILVATVVFFGIYGFFETRTDPQIGMIAVGMTMPIAIASAVGVINCFIFEAFPWWQQIWSILMRPLFLMSCIFFIYDDIPQPYRDYLWWNPLVHVVGQMRAAFFPNYLGEYVSYTYVFGISLSFFAIGLALLVRYHRDLQNS